MMLLGLEDIVSAPSERDDTNDGGNAATDANVFCGAPVAFNQACSMARDA